MASSDDSSAPMVADARSATHPSSPMIEPSSPMVEGTSQSARSSTPIVTSFEIEQSAAAQITPSAKVPKTNKRVYRVKIARSLETDSNFMIIVREIRRRYKAGAQITQNHLFFARIDASAFYLTDQGHTLWNSRNVYALICAMLESNEYEIKRENGMLSIYFNAQIIVSGKCIAHDPLVIRCRPYRIGANVSYTCT